MRLQTRLSQPLELSFFFGSPQWLDAVSVLDVGTGNAHYLRQLATYFPAKRYVGIDTDAAPVEIAKRGELGAAPAAPAPAIEFLLLDAHDVRGEYDVALARLLVQHLPSLPDFLTSMRQALKPGGTLIVIESADEHRRFVPPLPSMTHFCETFRARRRSRGR